MPKIILVGLIVATSQLIGVVTSSFLSLNGSHEILAVWANIESVLALLTAILFFGHQHSLNRDLVSCKSEVVKQQLIRGTQSTIFSLSLVCMLIFGTVSVVLQDIQYAWLAIIIVFIGMSPDFSLYGLSKPVQAGVISLLKVGVPSLTLFFMVFWGLDSLNILFFGVAASYLSAALLVLIFTGIGVRAPIASFNKLKDYLVGYKLGLPTLILTGLRALPVIVSTSFFGASEVIFLVLFYKYLLLGVGVKRLLVQTYYKGISSKLFSLKVDVLCFLGAGLGITVLSYFYKDVMAIIGFDLESDKVIYFICLILVLLNFIGVSNGTRIILLGKDGFYFSVHVVSAIFMISFVVFGGVYGSLSLVFFGGVAAETVLVLGMMAGRVFYETRT